MARKHILNILQKAFKQERSCWIVEMCILTQWTVTSQMQSVLFARVK